MSKEHRVLQSAAFLVLLVFSAGACVVSRSTSSDTLTRISANASAVTPTPLDRARLYPRFHDLPDPALRGQARVLKLTFADSGQLIDVPETVQTALLNHWVALENYHRAKDEGLNLAQATFDHSMAWVHLRNTLESAPIETSNGLTRLSEGESNAVIDTQVMLFGEARSQIKRAISSR